MESLTAVENHAGTSLHPDQLPGAVDQALAATKFIDMHTHLFMPSLGRLGLWGIDELLTYHYLEAELFRSARIRPPQYHALSKREQADLIWRTLFIENTPISEATRGVIAVLQSLDLAADDLRDARDYFAKADLDSHITRVFALAGMSEAVMTNDPLDPVEAPLWQNGAARDHRFHPVLRLDRILSFWPAHWQELKNQGYDVDGQAGAHSIDETRRFLIDWCVRMKPVYMACSLEDTFTFPQDSIQARLLAGAVLPACEEFGVPMSLMIGVRRQVNPALRLAGDAAGRADLRSLEHLCLHFPNNRFLVSVLSRENQHELCVYARKFANMMPFGCWWFLNNPSIVEEMTAERMEMLGTSFIPQHSDARVLEQVIYKWRNTRRTLAPLLVRRYALLVEDGGRVTRSNIDRDVNRLFRGNFETFTGMAHV
jgi:hypothetical protein